MRNEDRIKDEEIMDILEEMDIVEDDQDEAGEGFEPMDDDDLQAIVRSAVEDAVDFITSEIQEDRIKAQRYYDGKTDLAHEDGRSGVVSTKVRDTVRAIKPSLMRVFLSSSKIVEFIPRGPEDVMMAEQATTYIHWKFNDLGGFRILSDVFHDALVKRIGIAKAYYEEKNCTKIYTYTGLNDMQFQALIMDDDVQILEHTQTTEAEEMQADGMVMQQPPVTTHDVKIARVDYEGDIAVESIPPEEFFFDRNARSLEDCYVCGQRTDMRIGDLVSMGFEYEDLIDLDSSLDADDQNQAEEFERRGYSVDPDEDESAMDPSMKKVMVTEAYMRIDREGVGAPILHRVILGGTAYKVLDIEPCDEIPYAIFQIDHEPHTLAGGHSIADLTINDQDATTSILRGILDNVAMTNNPRIGIVEGQVSVEDVMNNEIGGIIRQRAPGMVQSYDVPFTAGQTMGALQYMDALVEQKTGVTRASMGLDPDALQSTTKAAVSATMAAAAGQVEVMARNLAEGGMRRLFGLMLRLMVKHAEAETMMRLNGMFQPADPRVWDASMDLSVNVGLGTGREEEKAAAYREILGMQMQIMQGYGPQNGMVTLTGIRNTLTDMLASAGIRNAERYFSPMNPQIEQQLMQQMQQAQQGQQQPDPNAAYLQAEQIKAQVKMQSDQQRATLDMQKAQADHQRKLEQMRVDQDLQRDRMAQDLELANTELMAKYGIKASEAIIKAEQNAPRDQNGVAQY